MEALERLLETARRQYQENDLPERLFDSIFEIANMPEKYSGRREEIMFLVRQLEDFDPYAGIGCFGDAVSAAAIEAIVSRLRGE